MAAATPPPDGSGSRRGLLYALLAVVALAIVAGVVVVLAGGDDDEDVATDGTATTTSAPTTTAAPDTTESPATTAAPDTTGTTAPPPTSGPETTEVPDELTTAVWPWADDDLRYDDPVEAARGFAEDFVGFDDPVVGEFMAGDSRSGEVEVRAMPNGPATTVFVRQLDASDTWWVLGSATADIEIDEPAALSAIDDPVQLVGRARAFEGTVNVEVRVDGQREPLAEGFVTGRGDGELGPFSEELAWPNPGGGWGAVVFLTRSAENGQVWQAGVVRVGFIGGD